MLNDDCYYSYHLLTIVVVVICRNRCRLVVWVVLAQVDLLALKACAVFATLILLLKYSVCCGLCVCFCIEMIEI